MDSHPAHLYYIKNNKNGKEYVGMTFSSKKNKTIYDRFKEHMKGKGSSYIREDIKNGIYSVDDFEVFLIESSYDLEYVREREIEEIKSRGSLYPNGYNGNIGKFIIMTDVIKKKISDTMAKNKDKYISAALGWATYKCRNDFSIVKRLRTDDPLVLSGEYVGVLALENVVTTVERKKIKEKNRVEKAMNGGRTHKGAAADDFLRSDEFREILISNENWKKGREKYRNRLSSGQLTEAEMRGKEKQSESVKRSWSLVDVEEKKQRTSNGLEKMNSLEICIHCGIKANVGNIRRWHNQNCKKADKKSED
jgi:hypothetical protein